MDYKIFQLLVDFGLVVLIFLVQLCIYPAFKYFNTHNLQIWHKVYTPNITIVVFPLMIGQLAFSLYSVFNASEYLSWVHLVLVICTWISTFLYFVPLHQKINTNNYIKDDLLKLEKGNWFRLILWCLVFMITLFRVIFL